MPVDYRMLAETPYININSIGNALAVRQHLQDQPMRQMQSAAELERARIQNRILFMEEAQRAEAEKIQRAQRETAMNIGLSAEQGNVMAAGAAPPQNALAGGPQAPTAAPTPPGWVPPMALPPEGGNAFSAPAARIPYSPEAWGRYSAAESQRQTAMKEAKETFTTLLKSAVDTGSQDMVDSLIRAGKKSPALSSMIGFIGDPDGPENQRLRVVGKGEAETESYFSQEQLDSLSKNANSDVVKKAIESAKPGVYAIKTKGNMVVGFKPSAGAAKPLSDIGKLEHDRDLKVDALVAAGKYKTRDEAKADPEVKKYDQEIDRKAAGKEDPRARYLELMTRAGMNDPARFPVSDEDKRFMAAYEREKKLGAEEYGKMRLEMMLQNPISVYDTNTGAIGFKTKREINDGDASNAKKGLPPRYTGAEQGIKLKSRLAIFDEIETSAKQLQDAAKKIKFTQSQMAKFAFVLKVDDDGSALRNLIHGDIGKTLTRDEIDYVTAAKNLRESAFSLRTVGGMGQGSDMLRSAIASVVPGTTTPSKAYLDSAMARFNTQVKMLRGGIPGIGAETQRRASEKAESDKVAVVETRTLKDGTVWDKFSDGTYKKR